MDWLRQLRFKFLGFWRNGDRAADMAEEMRAHLERLIAANIDAGLSPEQARTTALKQFGNVSSLQQRSRDEWRFRWFEECRDDVRFAVRQMRRSPSFTAVAAITLALGIGANSAMFALADRTLLRPLPYPDPERLVMMSERGPRGPRMPVSPLTLQEWHDQNHTFETIAAISTGLGGGPMLSGRDGVAASVERQSVSASFFDVLRVTPVAGRTFLAADESLRPTVVVLSEGVWRSRFGADPGLIGQDVRLNGDAVTVIGVVSNDVQLSRPAGIWTLIPVLPPTFKDRNLRFFEVVGRLKSGVAPAAAESDLSAITERLSSQYPDPNNALGVTVEPLRTGIVGVELERTSAFLLGVVAFVLLMCCANIANLLMARARVRGRELAVRAALGAGQARIVRQLLTESLVLAALGGVLGLVVGKVILDAAPALVPAGLLPPAVSLTFDARVAIFCAVAALTVGLLFGVLPAWQATGASPLQAMGGDSRTVTSGAGIIRSALAAGQIAAAVLLMCGAGLLLRTLVVLGDFDTGYQAESENVLTMDFSIPGLRYGTPEKLLQYYDNVERDVRALPGVTSVGWSSTLPFGSTELGRWPFAIVGDAPVDPAAQPRADYAIATAGFFETVDLPIVAGRAFTERDTRQSTPVCIVNEAFARRHLQGRNPIGQRVSIQPRLVSAPAVREVVGVARQVKGRPDEVDDMLQVYVPQSQVPFTDPFLVVRTAGQAGAFVPSILAAAARSDPNVPIRRARTLDDIARESTARYRFRAQIAAIFAALALLLAMVGVFGVVMYSVQQRSREFAMRIALGASRANVLKLVFGSASRVIAAGAVAGVVAAAVLARSIAAFLFRVQPLDPLTFAIVVAGVGVTALIASAAPALRAARVDPLETFRCE